MGRNGDIVVAGITFLPPTTMRMFSVHDEDGTTVQAFLLFAAGLGPKMETQTIGTIKGQVALVADGVRFLEFIIVRTWSGLVSIAGPASSPLAGMVSRIVLVITAITFRAPIAFVDETFYGGTPLVMIVRLENDDLLFSVGATEYEEEGMVAAENFQLVRRVKAGKILLEFSQLCQPARTFGHPCRLVKLPSIDALPGKTSTKCVPVTAGHVMTVVAVTVRPHGHNGPGAAQFIFVFYLDDALFPFTVLLHRSLTHIVLFSPPARGRHSHQYNIDLQSPVRVKFLVGI